MVPPWFAQSLTGPALAGADTPRRDDGRSRRSLAGDSRSVRGSKTIFHSFRIFSFADLNYALLIGVARIVNACIGCLGIAQAFCLLGCLDGGVYVTR